MAYEGCPCVWLEETGRVGVLLRRFTFSDRVACPDGGGHDASFAQPVEYRPLERDEDGTRPGDAEWPREDGRWPAACACGYAFAVEDQWQANLAVEWRRQDGSLVVADAHRLPPGSLFHLMWDPWGGWRDRYGDGINLHGVCPNGAIWGIDGPAVSDGKVTTEEAWTRTGNPRVPATLSVTPSIVAGDYHGHLTAGAFTAG